MSNISIGSGAVVQAPIMTSLLLIPIIAQIVVGAALVALGVTILVVGRRRWRRRASGKGNR